jgi:hypothetical protein
MLLLGGAAIDKAAVFRILGGWFHRAIDPGNLRDAAERLRGAWVAQLEIDAIARHPRSRPPPEWQALRGFVVASADRLRDRAGRIREHDRQCVFGASTRREAPEFGLGAVSGGWCFVRCGPRIDLDGLVRDRDQLWAETLVRYGAGERPDIDLIKSAPRVASLGDIKDAVSIMRVWLASNCEVHPEYQVEKDVLYEDHCVWREACGLEPVNKQWFGRLLRTACPGRENYRSGDGEVRCGARNTGASG